jgi:hypothetical protein
VRRAKLLAQDGLARSCLTPSGDVSFDQQPVYLRRQRRLEGVGQRRTDYCTPQPVDCKVGSEERDHATPPAEEC